ncbi:MAG TPA: hypothetical protein VG538_05895 [Vicinamibacterales bacterium]|jgi:hypothetical protein|nr:hypothetical protein [Vicinamibacterales bacterium]
MSELREHLVAARALIAQGWCRNADARDRTGRSVQSTSDAACAWCIEGAIFRVTHTAANDWPLCQMVTALMGAREYPYSYPFSREALSAWNDKPGRTQADVLALFDRAIEAAQ